jgi:hypothetical protein
MATLEWMRLAERRQRRRNVVHAVILVNPDRPIGQAFFNELRFQWVPSGTSRSCRCWRIFFPFACDESPVVVRVLRNDGRRYNAEVFANDRTTDYAIPYLLGSEHVASRRLHIDKTIIMRIMKLFEVHVPGVAIPAGFHLKDFLFPISIDPKIAEGAIVWKHHKIDVQSGKTKHHETDTTSPGQVRVDDTRMTFGHEESNIRNDAETINKTMLNTMSFRNRGVSYCWKPTTTLATAWRTPKIPKIISNNNGLSNLVFLRHEL